MALEARGSRQQVFAGSCNNVGLYRRLLLSSLYGGELINGVFAFSSVPLPARQSLPLLLRLDSRGARTWAAAGFLKLTNLLYASVMVVEYWSVPLVY